MSRGRLYLPELERQDPPELELLDFFEFERFDLPEFYIRLKYKYSTVKKIS